MPITVKDISAVAAKWSQRAQAAGSDFTAGVKATTKDWAALTSAAADSWATGVTTAAGDGRFGRGVNAAGTAKWQNNTITKGGPRYPQGVAAAGPAYQAGFAPYLSVIASQNLPPRAPRGSPSNVNRVAQIAAALHAKKIGG